jgi:hypothetical protein
MDVPSSFGRKRGIRDVAVLARFSPRAVSTVRLYVE